MNSRGGVVDGVFRPDFDRYLTSMLCYKILGGSHVLESQKLGGVRGQSVRVDNYALLLCYKILGGSNVTIPKVGGVRTPPTRAVAAPMLIIIIPADFSDLI